MPLVLNDSVRDLSKWAFGSPLLSSILGSCIFVAILITFIMIFLIMIMYPAKSGTPFSVVAKMFVYMLFSNILIIFLHDGILKDMHDEKEEEDRDDSIILGSTTPDIVYNANYKPVNPALLYNNQLANNQLANNQLANNQLANNQLANNQLANNRQDIISIAETGPVTGGSVLGGVKVQRKVVNPYA